MVSKRQREARKRFKSVNPQLFPKPQPLDPNSKKKKKKKVKKMKPSSFKKTKSKPGDGNRKHPLRVPGMRPGESCFICKSTDHIAMHCPTKAEWEKNKICLLCRKRGHSLKNCHEKNDGGERKCCYNCGQTGHSLSKCPQPLQDGGTKYASCFICKEQGHLSKNCPKNTRGIYPKGGSCKTCGGVTHLAKDCPNKGRKQVSSSGEGNASSKGGGELWEGKLTVFRSGDDLEDDFALDAENSSKKARRKTSDSGYSVTQKEKSIPTQTKKSGPKVVNFVG